MTINDFDSFLCAMIFLRTKWVLTKQKEQLDRVPIQVVDPESEAEDEGIIF